MWPPNLTRARTIAQLALQGDAITSRPLDDARIAVPLLDPGLVLAAAVVELADQRGRPSGVVPAGLDPTRRPPPEPDGLAFRATG